MQRDELESFVNHRCGVMQRSRIGAFPIITAVAFALAAFACHKRDRVENAESNRTDPDSVETAMASPAKTAVTRTEMRGMAMRIMAGVTMHIAYLSGAATPLHRGEPVVLDDPRSYHLDIDRAESRITYANLARLMNDHVFAYKGAPIKGLRIERE